MKTTDLLVDLFLMLGVACQLVCCLGVVVMRNVLDRLHYTGAGTTLGPIFVGVAVLIRESISAGGLETIAAVAFLFLLNPVLTIATARAARRLEP